MHRSRLFWKLFLWIAGAVGVAIGVMYFFAAPRLAAVDRAGLQQTAWLTGAALLVGAAFVAGRITRPVRNIRRAAKALLRGDYSDRVYISRQDELGDLGRLLNQLSHEVGAQVNELREGGQQQATVLGGMIEGVIAIDGGERVLFANAAAGKLFGFIPPQIEGRPILEVVRHHALHQAVEKAIEAHKPQRLEIEWEGAERLSLMVQVTPLPGEPCPGVVVVLHDTTELRRLESLRRDFVANVSHELKTPLSSIKAYTETLLDGALGDEKHNTVFVRRIEEQADRLHNLIQDLSALARIESAQQPLEMTRVSVGSVVRACVADYQKLAEGKAIELSAAEVDNDAGEPAYVTADAEGLRVVLNNLIDNAVKYTPNGARVRVAWEKRIDDQADDPRVVIEVIDTGIGIPSDALSRVFERFYRVDKARSREMGGTGLGLAIVKHIVQSFDGKVSVDSQVGQGTQFKVELPSA